MAGGGFGSDPASSRLLFGDWVRVGEGASPMVPTCQLSHHNKIRSKEHLRIFSGQRERGKAKGTSASSCDDTAVGSMARHDDALWCVVVVFLASFTEYILLFFSFSYFSKTTSFFPFDILQGISVKVQSNK